MRILIIIGSFKMGGAERMSINTGEELIRRGFDVYFVLQRPIFEIPNSICPDRIFVLRDLKRTDFLYKFSSLFLGIRKISRKINPDIIIGFSRFSSFLASFTLHSKIIARFDAYPYRMNRKQRFWADFVINSPFVKKIVVPSTGMIDKLGEKRPGGKNKYTLIPNSIDSESVIKKANTDFDNYNFEYITAMGRFSPQKNFELLLRAYSKSVIQNKYKLVIIGDGSYKSTLVELVDTLDLKEKVVFTGNLTNPFPIIKNSEFFVNPSKFESFGNVILEALILGRPVIATNCSFGPSDMIQSNKNGFLIKDNDEDEMVEKLDLLGNNKLLIHSFRNSSVLSAEEFYIQNIGDKWEELIESL